MVYSRVVTDRPTDTPKRAAYKAAEVCAIAQIQPYVLRSWESEFPRLGVTRGAGVARIYRQTDLEQVLRIKQLVFDEGLTLAGARRRLESETEPQPDLPLEEFLSADAKERIAHVRQGLRDLLSMLGDDTRHARDRNGTATVDAAQEAASEPADAGQGVDEAPGDSAPQDATEETDAPPVPRRTPRRPRTERVARKRA